MLFPILALLGQAQLDHYDYLPATLPEWADSVSLEAGEDYVNERPNFPDRLRQTRPRIKVSELVGGFQEDADLIPGAEDIHRRPAGVKFVGEDDTDFTLKRNGLVRSASWAPQNWLTSYLIVAEPKPGDGRLFAAWLTKLRAVLGKPSFAVKHEFVRERTSYVSQESTNDVVWFADDASQIAFAWVWGVRDATARVKDSRELWNWTDDSEPGPHHKQTYSITLIYTAPTVHYKDVKDRKGERFPARISFNINPFGTLAG